jgi:tight adherence protein C
MDSILNLIESLVADPSRQATAFVGLVAVAGFIFVLGLTFFFVGVTDPVKRRLGRYVESDNDESEDRRLVKVHSMLGSISHWVMPTKEIELNETSKKLTYAGIRSPKALQSFYGIKAMATVTLPVLLLIAARWIPDLATMNLIFYGFVAAAVGLIAPSFILDKLAAKRIKLLRNGFPDALDLLVVCVESGLGLAAALQRVADELTVSHPELATELALVNAEMRVGVERTQALRNFADRTGVDDIRGLVSLLIQTMRFGTGVAEALRVYSEEFRDKRMQKAEEQAAKIGTKLIFPLVTCFFPSFFIVAIGPAVIRLIDVFAVMQG